LILSNLAGAARELSSAVLVNPYDIRGVSHAMQAALGMPLAERRDRYADMMKVLRRNDIAAWVRRFMEALEQTQAAETRVRVVNTASRN
jgi:trehalose 6-phosphate synthase